MSSDQHADATRSSSSPRAKGRLHRIAAQFFGGSPFGGSIHPGRVPLVSFSSRPSLPFPHPLNYREPLRILETFFFGADAEPDPGRRHNRYLHVPGFSPVLVTRDPGVIKAVSAATGDKPGQFDRDTLPTGGIARATGEKTLLYANGRVWREQKQIVAPPFARSTLYQPENFAGFEQAFRSVAMERLGVVRERMAQLGQQELRVSLEPEIKAVMLDMLINCFFGAPVDTAEVRDRHVPALDNHIDNIVRDTVMAKVGCPMHRLPGWLGFVSKARKSSATFEELVNKAIAARAGKAGAWKQFESDAPDSALRPNIRVFLAGALEATTSYASWAIAHLARNPERQERLYAEVRGVNDYSPDALHTLEYLACVLNETLRLTPALYFHPRRPSVDTTVTTDDGRTLWMPKGTHVLMDVWHANRHEDHFGVEKTGHRADAFVPERWLGKGATDQGTRDWMHFGFGHGPRFCPGKNLGQLEVALVVGAVVKMFKLRAVSRENPARASVSTKPADGVLVDLSVRD